MAMGHNPAAHGCTSEKPLKRLPCGCLGWCWLVEVVQWVMWTFWGDFWGDVDVLFFWRVMRLIEMFFICDVDLLGERWLFRWFLGGCIYFWGDVNFLASFWGDVDLLSWFLGRCGLIQAILGWCGFRNWFLGWCGLRLIEVILVVMLTYQNDFWGGRIEVIFGLIWACFVGFRFVEKPLKESRPEMSIWTPIHEPHGK